MATAFAAGLFVHYKKGPPISYAFYLPLLVIFFMALIFSYCRKRRYWLRKHRIYNPRPAPIYPHLVPVYGVDWLLDMVKAINNASILNVLHERFIAVSTTFWH